MEGALPPHRGQGASFENTMVPEAANMPPTPWAMLILAFGTWAGAENLEERVDGVGQIDPVVLEELRHR